MRSPRLRAASAATGTLLLVAHGSRDPRFAATARRVASSTRRALPGVRVELAYLDLNEPLVDDVLDSLDGNVTVLPLLFGDGFHSKHDLPEMLRRAHLRNPGLRATQARILGQHSPVPALVDRLAQAAALHTLTTPTPLAGPGDAGARVEAPFPSQLGVVLCAVGSSDPTSDASAIARGRELSRALGAPVRTVFATRLGPDGAALRDAVADLRNAGATTIAASPLFLSAGLLTERVERLLDEIAPGSVVAGPLADHPTLIDAIVALHRAVPRSGGVAVPA